MEKITQNLISFIFCLNVTKLLLEILTHWKLPNNTNTCPCFPTINIVILILWNFQCQNCSILATPKPNIHDYNILQLCPIFNHAIIEDIQSMTIVVLHDYHTLQSMIVVTLHDYDHLQSITILITRIAHVISIFTLILLLYQNPTNNVYNKARYVG
jgi:hypothetical protein